MDDIKMPDSQQNKLEKAQRMLDDIHTRISETEQSQLRATTEAERFSCAAALAQLRHHAVELAAQIDNATASFESLENNNNPVVQQ